MDKNEVLSFVNFQSQQLKCRQILTRISIMWLISIPCGILGVYSTFTTIFFSVFDILFTIFSIWLIILKKRGIYQNIFIGLYLLYISIILVFASYKFLFIHGEGKIWVIFIQFFILFANIVLFQFVVKRNIKNGTYSKENPENKNIFIISLGGAALGTIFSRVFLRNTTQEVIELILSGTFYLVALFLSVGTVSLYKAYLQHKYKL